MRVVRVCFLARECKDGKTSDCRRIPGVLQAPKLVLSTLQQCLSCKPNDDARPLEIQVGRRSLLLDYICVRASRRTSPLRGAISVRSRWPALPLRIICRRRDLVRPGGVREVASSASGHTASATLQRVGNGRGGSQLRQTMMSVGKLDEVFPVEMTSPIVSSALGFLSLMI